MASEIALLAGLAFVGALIVGVTGFGSALVTIPLATHFVGLENPRNAARDEWRRLVPMILVGTALGVTLAGQPAARRRHVSARRFRALVRALQPGAARTAAGHPPRVGMARRPVRRHYQHAVRRRRAAVRGLSLEPRTDEGAVPRHHGLRHDDQHLAARAGVPHHRAPAPALGLDCRRGGGAGCAAGSMAGAAPLPAHLARSADARGGGDPALLRRLAYGPRSELTPGRGSPGR